MKRRLYFLVPHVGTARQIVNELLLARIEERNIHALAREGTEMGDLPQANLFQRSDFVHGVEVGIAVGGATGAAAGALAMMFPPANMALGFGTVLALALGGAGIGAWVSGMIATDIPNSRLAEFEEALDGDQILMMVDVDKDQVEPISHLVKDRHPETTMQGTEPTIPAFP